MRGGKERWRGENTCGTQRRNCAQVMHEFKNKEYSRGMPPRIFHKIFHAESMRNLKDYLEGDFSQ